ncbi:MAG: septum formation inhibitor Maf [Myxococcota bacterium]
MTRALCLLSLLLLLLAACGGEERHAEAQPAAPAAADALGLETPEAFARAHGSFGDYWYQGKAELTRFRLTQSRYGEAREGEAVLVFVTEPFLPDAQVKHELRDGRPDVSVLKLNQYRRFYTGVYPYTLMTSAFLPATGEDLALKATHSMQEWCGMAFAQLNRRDDGLHLEQRSYFQQEGDREDVLPDAPLEDALFSRIRRDPGAIAEGETALVPGLHFLRFAHQPLRAYAARIARTRGEHAAIAEGPLEVLTVTYPELGRTLRVYFRAAFPHVIEGWEEEGRGPTTRAVRTHAYLDAYWSRNGNEDAPYREALGLRF